MKYQDKYVIDKFPFQIVTELFPAIIMYPGTGSFKY